MTTITREWLLQTIAEYEANRDELPFGLDTNSAIELQAFKIAPASLEADSDSSIHPAHGPLSNGRLHRIREILGKAAAQSDGGNIGYAMSDAVKAIDELLDVRKVEPVAYIRSAHNPDGFCFADGIHPTHRHQRLPLSTLQDGCYWKVTPLYTAPPEPVVPATLPCSVELKPGLIIGKGCKTETLLTALQRRADYYAEIDAMTPEERAEHDANIEAFKSMLPQPVPDERKAFETFMNKRFSDTIDQSRAKNGDQGYMAWDMAVAWVVWQGRAELLEGGKS